MQGEADGSQILASDSVHAYRRRAALVALLAGSALAVDLVSGPVAQARDCQSVPHDAVTAGAAGAGALVGGPVGAIIGAGVGAGLSRKHWRTSSSTRRRATAQVLMTCDHTRLAITVRDDRRGLRGSRIPRVPGMAWKACGDGARRMAAT
ncbi:hypothetical protein [Amycolatopsis sp. NPDC003731]